MAERVDTRPRARLAAREAVRLADAIAASLALPDRERRLLRHAAAFGPWAWSAPGRRELEALERDDPTRRVRDLRALLEAGESLDPDFAATPPMRLAAQVAGVCVRYQVGRLGGRSVEESGSTALSWCGPAMDPEVAAALTAAFAPGGSADGRAA